jgi:hypothetical protein
VQISDREIEEPLSSSGREEKKVLRRADVPVRSAFASEWYQSGNISLLSVAEREKIHHAT